MEFNSKRRKKNAYMLIFNIGAGMVCALTPTSNELLLTLTSSWFWSVVFMYLYLIANEASGRDKIFNTLKVSCPMSDSHICSWCVYYTGSGGGTIACPLFRCYHKFSLKNYIKSIYIRRDK